MHRDHHTQLITAPHLQGVLELDVLWQDHPTTAILFHPNPVEGGTMHNKVVQTLYRYARDKGYNVIAYNSRGVGRSSGVASASLLEYEDARCVLDWAVSLGADDFWLGGFSFGGYMACLLATYIEASANISLNKLCLIAPSIKRLDSQKLSVPTTKTFLIYGDKDELVSPSALASFAKLNALNHEVLATGHFFHGQLTALKQAITRLDAGEV